MSKSKKGIPAPGKEYWGKRPLGFGASGKRKNKREEKQIGIQRERSINKRRIKRENEDE